MKRNWNNDREIENLAMANCLTLLNRVGQSGSGRVFHCKTCNKQFSSFQALGGHRTSHKRPKSTDETPAPAKAKTHECSICGLEFELGQALGGHMRRHRDALAEKSGRTKVAVEVAVVEEVDGGRRGLFLDLDLDLNLTPFQNEVKIWRRSGTAAIAI